MLGPEMRNFLRERCAGKLEAGRAGDGGEHGARLDRLEIDRLAPGLGIDLPGERNRRGIGRPVGSHRLAQGRAIFPRGAKRAFEQDIGAQHAALVRF